MTDSRTGGCARCTFYSGLVILASYAPAWAEDNTDYIFNGPTQTTNFGGALYIPMSSPGTNNSLQILNGGAVTNAGGALGPNSGDNFNRIVVSGTGSYWQSTGDYSIGSVGSYNSLIITNGGGANLTGHAYIGSTGSVSNRVLVSGTSSTLTSAVIITPGTMASVPARSSATGAC